MFLVFVLVLQREIFRVQNLLAVVVFDHDPKALRERVKPLIPNEIWGQNDVHFQRRTRDWLHVRLNIHSRELVDKLMYRFTHFRKSNQLADFLRSQFKILLPTDVFAFDFHQDVVRDGFELSQRRLRGPRFLSSHFAQVERFFTELRPSSFQDDFKDTSQQSSRGLGDVHHIRR